METPLSHPVSHPKVLILDFGSQFTQLIARRIRELNVYSEIQPFSFPLEKIQADPNIKAIILSGGPDSVYDSDAPQINPAILDLGLPILGICYGLQLLALLQGGQVEGSEKREYGRASLEILKNDFLFSSLGQHTTVWMSHGDHLTRLPQGFEVLASTENSPMAAIGDNTRQLYGIQFHPEVYHSLDGTQILANFLFQIANLEASWSPNSFIQEQVQKIQTQVGTKQVLCGLSGGVDSAVTAVLIHKAIGNQLQCVFVDNGLLRTGEREEVEKIFKQHFQIKLEVVDAKELFLGRLVEVTDPEVKRKIIGATFIEVFEQTAKQLAIDGEEFEFLAQGTLYPDVIESVSFTGGPSVTIKSHHNVGGLPEKMNFRLLEPLRELFKDEVRQIGRNLSIPEEIIGRHPFPGPGLAIRIIGDVTEPKLELLRQADFIFTAELKQTKNPATDKSLYEETWQAFAVLTPVQSVGVMGDGRTYENLLGLRAVTAVDGMTADWAHLPYDFLAKVSNRIINEVRGINRVVYDISSKPPATIEWE